MNLLITAISLALLAISGVVLLLHLRHPERMFNAFRNLGAGVAQEGVCVALFGIVLLANFILTWKKDGALRWLRGCGSRCMNRALVKNGVVVRQGARSWVPAAGSRRTGAPGVHAYPRWLQQSDG